MPARRVVPVLAATGGALALLAMAMLANPTATLVVGVAGIGLLLVLRPLRAVAKRRSRTSAEFSPMPPVKAIASRPPSAAADAATAAATRCT